MVDEHLLTKVRAYLSENLSLEELDGWIVRNLHAFLPPRRDVYSGLASVMQLWVSEFQRGHRTEAEIRQLAMAHLLGIENQLGSEARSLVLQMAIGASEWVLPSASTSG